MPVSATASATDRYPVVLMGDLRDARVRRDPAYASAASVEIRRNVPSGTLSARLHRDGTQVVRQGLSRDWTIKSGQQGARSWQGRRDAEWRRKGGGRRTARSIAQRFTGSRGGAGANVRALRERDRKDVPCRCSKP